MPTEYFHQPVSSLWLLVETDPCPYNELSADESVCTPTNITESIFRFGTAKTYVHDRVKSPGYKTIPCTVHSLDCASIAARHDAELDCQNRLEPLKKHFIQTPMFPLSGVLRGLRHHDTIREACR